MKNWTLKDLILRVCLDGLRIVGDGCKSLDLFNLPLVALEPALSHDSRDTRLPNLPSRRNFRDFSLISFCVTGLIVCHLCKIPSHGTCTHYLTGT